MTHRLIILAIAAGCMLAVGLQELPGGGAPAHSIMVLGFMLIAGAFGLCVVPPRDWRTSGLLLLVIAFVCGLHTLVFAHSRYHLPLMPLVLIYAAAALTHLGLIWQRRATARFWAAAAVVALLLAGWGWEIVVVDFQRFMEALS